MHLLIDQNIPRPVADELLVLGYNTSHASHLGLAKADDGVIIQYALARQMTLVTQDLGIATKIPSHHFGLITLRRLPVSLMATAIANTLKDLAAYGITLDNALVTIERGRYRVRTP
jgi:predicted nuclease of predicted toxin-antitoxin system